MFFSSPLLSRRVSSEKLASLDAVLENADWSRVFESDDINLSFDYFMEIFNFHLDNVIPKQKKKPDYKKTPRLPWISKSILRSINRKIDCIIDTNWEKMSDQNINTLHIKIL